MYKYQLLLHHHVGLHAIMVPALIAPTKTSETVKKIIFSFIRIVMIIAPLHHNKTLTKTEVAIIEQNIAVIVWSMMFVGRMSTLGLWIRKEVEHFK